MAKNFIKNEYRSHVSNSLFSHEKDDDEDDIFEFLFNEDKRDTEEPKNSNSIPNRNFPFVSAEKSSTQTSEPIIFQNFDLFDSTEAEDEGFENKKDDTVCEQNKVLEKLSKEVDNMNIQEDIPVPENLNINISLDEIDNITDPIELLRTLFCHSNYPELIENFSTATFFDDVKNINNDHEEIIESDNIEEEANTHSVSERNNEIQEMNFCSQEIVNENSSMLDIFKEQDNEDDFDLLFSDTKVDENVFDEHIEDNNIFNVNNVEEDINTGVDFVDDTLNTFSDATDMKSSATSSIRSKDNSDDPADSNISKYQQKEKPFVPVKQKIEKEIVLEKNETVNILNRMDNLEQGKLESFTENKIEFIEKSEGDNQPKISIESPEEIIQKESPAEIPAENNESDVNLFKECQDEMNSNSQSTSILGSFMGLFNKKQEKPPSPPPFSTIEPGRKRQIRKPSTPILNNQQNKLLKKRLSVNSQRKIIKSSRNSTDQLDNKERDDDNK